MNIYKFPLLLTAVIFFIQVSAGAQKTGVYRVADSLYASKAYKQASEEYKPLVKDTSTDAFHLNRYGYSLYKMNHYPKAFQYYKQALASHPNTAIKASVLSRLSMLYAHEDSTSRALEFLDSAIASGYFGIVELDSSEDFQNIRRNEGFIQLRNKLFNSMYPCANDPHAREFDFWVGEWNVFQTGTTIPVGHSVIQKISGGCAILENWKSQVSEGKSLNFIDDSTGKWKQVWVGSYPNGKQDFVDGVYKDGAMQFTFYTKDAEGKPLLGRFRFFNQGTSQVRQFSETSKDAGKIWATNYDFTYLRVK
jgi:hypothetical protein